MPFNVEQLERYAWCIRAGELMRTVRYWTGLETFAPWDVMTAGGGLIWAAFSFESAIRWINGGCGNVPMAMSLQR
jgi:hypothetical protein